MKKLCIICGKEEAKVPDRNSTRPTLKLCIKCHSKRLAGDFINILNSKKGSK